jgi:hypothetical protein
MKLPQDKKERTQILVLIGIVSILAIYGLYQLVQIKVIQPRRDNATRMAQLEKDIREARLIVSQSRGNEQRNRELLAKIKEYSARHLLHPRLGGNLILGASEQVEGWFRQAGLETPDIRDGGRRAVYGRSDPVRDMVWAYTVGVSFRAGLHDLAKLLKIIEESDPCVTVVQLSIAAGNASDPRTVPQHAISFNVQWPMWRDDDYRATLENMTP